MIIFFIILIKENLDSFVTPLTYLFNQSLIDGQFTEILKIGIITPIYKNGDKTNITNYRPVCILSTISKIFEKCVSKKLC